MAARAVRDVATPELPPRVSWRTLGPRFVNEWEPGQHLAVIGPTGSGKSVVALDLLRRRRARRQASVLVLATKQRDETLTALGWPIIRDWSELTWDHREHRGVILWPSYGSSSRDDVARKAAAFNDALEHVLAEGGWTVYLDEAIYFVETLGMRRLLDEYWNTARSSGITVVSASQGVSWVPRAALTQQQWAIAFRFANEEVTSDVAKVLGGRRKFTPALESLGEHEFVMVRTRTGEAYRSQVPESELVR